MVTEDRNLTGSDEEIVAPVSRLARDEQWERLWRLARNLRLDHAVLAARQLGGWRPDDPEGRELVDRLSAADPATIAAVVAGAYTRIETTDSWLTPAHLSVAPNAS